MKVTGKIKNVVDFGAFVDLGLHETGLIHISELSDNFVKEPMEIVKVGDVKEFTILALDPDRKRISLSLKSDAASRALNPTEAKSGDKGGGGSPHEKKANGGAKRAVVVKALSKNADGTRQKSDGKNRQSSGVKAGGVRNDGMTYNPFADLLKNR